MRHAFISDVHANLEALEAVLRDIDKQKAGNIVFLGDAVGYGPNPNECINLLKENCDFMIAGNHDHAALGITDVSFFNDLAAEAIAWTFGVLGANETEILEKLPLTFEVEDHDIYVVHGSPVGKPEEWLYVLNEDNIVESFESFERRICIVGHSHRPFIAEKNTEGQLRAHPSEALFNGGSRYVVNDGSVGQPRDRDPRASYIIIDDDGIQLMRVDYDVEKVQKKIIDEGLPPQLAERLAQGR